MAVLFTTRKQRIAWIMLLVITVNMFSPATTYALTSGPTQPELQGFQPAGTSDMVDLFTGDFSYNIPLFELPGPNGGYPFNLSYQSGITVDQEASWVGLGWSLNPGAINRQMRGLPDDFKGDAITTKMSIDPSVTVGVGAGSSLELFGAAEDVGNVGLSIFYNSYKGFGYSIDASVGFGAAIRNGMTAGVGLNLSLNSQEGSSVSPSVSLAGKMGSYGLSGGYNSRSGFDRVSLDMYNLKAVKTPAQGKVTTSYSGHSSASLSLAHSGYTPQVSLPMRNINVAARFNLGFAQTGFFKKGYISGFYNEQYLKDNGANKSSAGYGYLYHDVGNSDAASVFDFNREKDGIVSKETPNLAIPSMTYDIYSVTGQGIGAMYRPIRNDVGILRDPQVTSESTGGALGIDVGPVLSKVGVNLSVNHSNSTSGAWVENNDIAKIAGFQSQQSNDPFEPWNFKVHGELTGEKSSILDNMGGTNAVRVHLGGTDEQPSASTTLEKKDGEVGQVLLDKTSSDRTRKQRNEVIQTFTNEQILKGGVGSEANTFFRNRYYEAGDAVGRDEPYTPDPDNPDDFYNRTNSQPHHIAGFIATTPDGLRYNYTIPVYNTKQEEVLFSSAASSSSTVDNTGPADGDPDYSNGEKMLKKVGLPAYAYSYLLTSIVGPDYVDLTNDGVTSDDLGYWVRFWYKNATSDGTYKWRDPFAKANFSEGWKSDPRDDKGSYTYGEKEVWYLVKAETKSHVAVFNLTSRDDSKGAVSRNQNTNSTGKTLKKLSDVKLYSKLGGNYPIKTVKFTHDYSLCPSTPNSTSGKLTLTSLDFTYGNSDTHLTPYIFTYKSPTTPYMQHGYDRWGVYKPYAAGQSKSNIDFPYTNQEPNQKSTLDANAAAWSLGQIRTPSGSTIIIDYESDDYGYVQHKQAMQMTSIVNPYVTPDQAIANDEFDLTDNRKIRFKLEKAITGTLTDTEQEQVVRSYLDEDRGQVYFKALMTLRKSNENLREYISGYVDIDFSAEMRLEKVGNDYVYGTFSLKKDSDFDDHPFSVRTWQHLRTNQPDIVSKSTELAGSTDGFQKTVIKNDKIGQIRTLAELSIFRMVRELVKGFIGTCRQNNWGREILASKSLIRLNSPDKIKFGGGLRVSQVTVKDNWQKDEEGIYGQAYDYTINEEGQTISSGVASYEPMIGGEENALRYAKTYTDHVPLRSDNNLYFEFPVNESYYPGAQVGYRRVTVTSIAAKALEGKPLKNDKLSDTRSVFPHGTNITYGTTGKVVHEFYTAKDFPVISDETEKKDVPFNSSIPIPFLGNVSISKLASSQGYSVITNDMHGKPKQVSTFRQNSLGGWETDPISWVRYNYACEPRIYQSEGVLSLKSKFVRNTDPDGTLSLFDSSNPTHTSLESYSIGQENEFFLDMRQYEDKSWQGGADANLDVVYIPLFIAPIPFPIPTIWPSIGNSTTQLRTVVSNKVIFTPGIIESIEAYDGSSLLKTKNVKWDRLTGEVVLSTVNNNFDNPVFTYNIPAYLKYQGLSGAYQNIGLKLNIKGLLTLTPGSAGDYYFPASPGSELLYPGDEIILYKTVSNKLVPMCTATYMGDRGGLKRLYCPDVPSAIVDITAMVSRSGYRNQLSAKAGTITALQDPSIPGTPVTYSKTVIVPKKP